MGSPKIVGNTTLWGIALAVGSFFCFPLHDAIVKWLVVDMAIWQILFVRSAMTVTLALATGGRATLKRAVRSPARKILVLRAVMTMLAWIAFYSAAKTLQLAELTAIYFSSPLLVALMAIPILKEKVSVKRWAALGIGFVGVLIVCQPENSAHIVALGLAAIAAVFWAGSMILMRQVGTTETTAVQMLMANSLIFVFCSLTMPAFWRMPEMTEWALLISVGTIGTVAQYLLFESSGDCLVDGIYGTDMGFRIWLPDLRRCAEIFVFHRRGRHCSQRRTYGGL